MNSQAADSVILQVENQTKCFGDVVANDCICFDVRKAEVHCLLGENGAGKTTLAECVFGYYRPDSGTIRFKGKKLHLSSPRDAIEAGIGMVHQDFILAPPMSVIENIAVGTQSKGLILDLKHAYTRVQELCDEYGVELDLDAPVEQLPVGKQQWVEILKALFQSAELLILDEPTSVLTPQESDRLFTALIKMKKRGLSIVLITHKLREVMGFTDRVTVLRNGRVVGTVSTGEVTREDLVNMMVGRRVDFRVAKEVSAPEETVFELRDLYVLGDNGQEELSGLTLEVRRKEIYGLAGVAGNGQEELFDVVVGVRRAESGKVILDGEDITNLSPSDVIAKGVASIPPDRTRQGLLMGFPIKENLILGYHNRRPFRKGIELKYKEIERFAERAISEYELVASSGKQTVKTLSGGNLQRLVLARELSHNPRFLLASSPTRGLDVAATRYVHQRLVELRDSGVGVLLVSEDLDEILSVSDRIAVIYRGQIVDEFDSTEATRESVGLLMAGFRKN